MREITVEEDAVPRFGELEAAIMDVVWRSEGQLLVRDVMEALRAERQMAFTTVQTVMENLHHKGWLERAKDGRAYRYWAPRPREDYTAQLLSEAFDTTSDRGAAFSRLLQRLEPHEVVELGQALEDAKNRRAAQ